MQYRTLDTRLLISIGLLLVAGCSWGTGQPMGIEMRKRSLFESEWRNYRKLEPHKSFAVAGDPDGVFTTGYAFGLPSSETAIEEALKFCGKRRAERRIKDDCVTWAVNDELISGDSD